MLYILCILYIFRIYFVYLYINHLLYIFVYIYIYILVQTDGLSRFLEKKDFDPSGFCIKSSYQDLVREFLFFKIVFCFLFFAGGIYSHHVLTEITKEGLRNACMPAPTT